MTLTDVICLEEVETPLTIFADRATLTRPSGVPRAVIPRAFDTLLNFFASDVAPSNRVPRLIFEDSRIKRRLSIVAEKIVADPFEIPLAENSAKWTTINNAFKARAGCSLDESVSRRALVYISGFWESSSGIGIQRPTKRTRISRVLLFCFHIMAKFFLSFSDIRERKRAGERRRGATSFSFHFLRLSFLSFSPPSSPDTDEVA